MSASFWKNSGWIAGLLAIGCASADIVINFDVNPNGQAIAAPAAFDSAGPLHNTYAAFGVHFSGPSSNQGGALLNSSSFVSHARSGFNFLAFSAVESNQFVGPETISFDSPVLAVSIYACSLGHPLTFTMQAFNAAGELVDSDSINAVGTGYNLLSVASDAGIRSVVLASPGAGFNAFVFDDLLATRPPVDCPGDLNGDGAVTLSDLSTLLSYFGTSVGASLANGDLDGDGDVDLTDLSTLLSRFGIAC